MMWCMAIGRSFLYDVEDENFNRYIIFHVINQEACIYITNDEINFLPVDTD